MCVHLTEAQLTHDGISVCHSGHSVGGWLGKCELGILPALEMLPVSEPAPSQHRLGAPTPVTAAQKCCSVAERTEMGVNQAGAMPGLGNLTHPKPVPGAAGTADKHCPAGCGAGWCPLNTGRSRQGNTGH